MRLSELDLILRRAGYFFKIDGRADPGAAVREINVQISGRDGPIKLDEVLLTTDGEKGTWGSLLNCSGVERVSS